MKWEPNFEYSDRLLPWFIVQSVQSGIIVVLTHSLLAVLCTVETQTKICLTRKVVRNKIPNYIYFF